MAAIETTLYNRLSGYAGLIALVSTRISPNIKAQDSALPAVTYRRVSSTRYNAMAVDAQVVKARFQVDVWASSYESAAAVRDQVRACLQRWRDGTAGAVVQDTFIVTETDLYEDDTHQHHIAIDVEINYDE